jgi:hypothetical protein
MHYQEIGAQITILTGYLGRPLRSTRFVIGRGVLKATVLSIGNIEHRQ